MPGAILFMGGMGRRGCIQAAALSAILFLADAADRRPSHAARGSRILQEDPGSSCRIPMGARAVPCILLRLRGGGAGGARGEGATARGGLGWPAAEVELSTKGIEGLLGADEDRPAASDSEGEQEESRETTTSLMSSNPCTEDEGDEDAKASQQDEGAIDRAGRPDGQHQTKADGAGMDLPPPPPRPWEDYIDKRRWTGGDIMAELERIEKLGPDRPNMIDERELDPEYGEEPYIGTDDEILADIEGAWERWDDAVGMPGGLCSWRSVYDRVLPQYLKPRHPALDDTQLRREVAAAREERRRTAPSREERLMKFLDTFVEEERRHGDGLRFKKWRAYLETMGLDEALKWAGKGKWGRGTGHERERESDSGFEGIASSLREIRSGIEGLSAAEEREEAGVGEDVRERWMEAGRGEISEVAEDVLDDPVKAWEEIERVDARIGTLPERGRGGELDGLMPGGFEEMVELTTCGWKKSLEDYKRRRGDQQPPRWMEQGFSGGLVSAFDGLWGTPTAEQRRRIMKEMSREEREQTEREEAFAGVYTRCDGSVERISKALGDDPVAPPGLKRILKVRRQRREAGLPSSESSGFLGGVEAPSLRDAFWGGEDELEDGAVRGGDEGAGACGMETGFERANGAVAGDDQVNRAISGRDKRGLKQGGREVKAEEERKKQARRRPLRPVKRRLVRQQACALVWNLCFGEEFRCSDEDETLLRYHLALQTVTSTLNASRLTHDWVGPAFICHNTTTVSFYRALVRTMRHVGRFPPQWAHQLPPKGPGFAEFGMEPGERELLDAEPIDFEQGFDEDAEAEHVRSAVRGHRHGPGYDRYLDDVLTSIEKDDITVEDFQAASNVLGMGIELLEATPRGAVMHRFVPEGRDKGEFDVVMCALGQHVWAAKTQPDKPWRYEDKWRNIAEEMDFVDGTGERADMVKIIEENKKRCLGEAPDQKDEGEWIGSVIKGWMEASLRGGRKAGRDYLQAIDEDDGEWVTDPIVSEGEIRLESEPEEDQRELDTRTLFESSNDEEGGAKGEEERRRMLGILGGGEGGDSGMYDDAPTPHRANDALK